MSRVHVRAGQLWRFNDRHGTHYVVMVLKKTEAEPIHERHQYDECWETVMTWVDDGYGSDTVSRRRLNYWPSEYWTLLWDVEG